jgi:ABC-type glycerol-3-phosphate transport system substrate-binding protein
MRTTMNRLGVLFAISTLLLAACGGSTVTPSAGASASAAPTTVVSLPPSTGATEAPSTGPTPVPTVPPGGPVTVKWFCCLGGGDDPSTLKIFAQLVSDFNTSHPNIKLVLDHVAYEGARDTFATELASGNGPDIVGPLGVGGANAFQGQWLDLSPYIARDKIDLTQFDPGAVNLYKSGGEGQLGLPFAIYPSELYYQPDMFDEAKLDYPPATYNTQYKMPDGSMVDWNYDTIRQVAMKLTVDKNGKDATDPAFDPHTSSSTGSSRSATTCERWAPPSSPRASSCPTTARPSRSRTPGRPRGSGSTTASGRTTSSRRTPCSPVPASTAVATRSTRARWRCRRTTCGTSAA